MQLHAMAYLKCSLSLFIFFHHRITVETNFETELRRFPLITFCPMMVQYIEIKDDEETVSFDDIGIYRDKKH
jgi:hypothetical protein